jgi:DNA-binding IclR family transcriptional regulator
MRQLGVVFQDEQSGLYRLGSRLFVLGEAAVDQFDLRHLAAPYVASLRDECRRSVVLSVAVNHESIVLSSIEYRDRISITSRAGNLALAHCSSQGRIALAFAPEEVQRHVLSRKLPRLTPYSMVDPKVIQARLRRIRENLYEDAPHEVMVGINALSCPLFRDDDVLVGVVAMLGTTADLTCPPKKDVLRSLYRTAEAISVALKCDIYQRRKLV